MNFEAAVSNIFYFPFSKQSF